MKNVKFPKLVLSALFMVLSSVVVFAAGGGTAQAADPGCYIKTGDSYIKTGNSSCSGGGRTPTEKCYYIAQGAPSYAGYAEINCGSFDAAAADTGEVQEIKFNNVQLTGGQCGGKTGTTTNGGATPDPTETSINLGCKGEGNPIIDMLLALTRFMSAGIGVVLVAAVIVVGIRYSFARGDANTTAQLKMHLFYIIVGLVIYLFSFAILNYVVPGGLLG